MAHFDLITFLRLRAAFYKSLLLLCCVWGLFYFKYMSLQLKGYKTTKGQSWRCKKNYCWRLLRMICLVVNMSWIGHVRNFFKSSTLTSSSFTRMPSISFESPFTFGLVEYLKSRGLAAHLNSVISVQITPTQNKTKGTLVHERG